MTKTKTKVTRAVALATFLGGLGACAESTSGEGGPTNSPNQDPVEAAIGELGVAIAGCDATTASGGNGFATNVLTLTVDSDPLVLSAAGGVFTANGYKCTQTVSAAQKPLKLADVKQISIKGTAHDNKVILDFLPGTFGTNVLAASMGGITIDFATTTGAGDSDSVMLRASSLAEKYKFAAVPATGTVTDIYVEINNDHTADIDIKPSAGTGAKLALTASMGGGNDEVIANPAPSEFDKFGSVTGLVIGGLPAAYGITAYGGPGDDKFTGGMGDDAFYGGDGADTFNMNSVTDGADIYSGDVGSDTVDYSGRTQALKIDLGPARQAAVGGADLRERSLYGVGGVLGGKVLAVVIDGVRTEYTFPSLGTGTPSVPVKPSDVIDQLNTALNTSLGTTGTVYASLTGKNRLQIMSASPSSSTTAFVKIDEDPAIASGGMDAASTIGFATPGPITTLPAVGNVDLSTGSLYGASGGLDTKQLVMLLNGVYVRVVFNAPADDTAALAAINTAANAALGTTGVKYATEDSSKFLNIAATKLDIKDATMAYTLPAASASTALGFRSSVEGNVDVTAAALFGGSGTLANASLGVVIDGARVDVAAGATPTDITGIVTAINTGFNTEFATTGKVYAFVNSAKNLVVTSNTDTANTSSVKFMGDPAVAAGTGVTEAATVLGFTPGTPGGAKLVGVDLTTSTIYAALASTRMILVVNGTYVVVDFTTPATATDVTTAINSAINTALMSGSVTYATKNAKTNKLELAATWISVRAGGTAAYTYTSAATATLGFGYNNGVKRTVSDPDDGLANERDDVRYSTENINGGSGDDVIIGNDAKNTIKGNGGNDVISGGANGATCNAADGDALLGGDGNDTFILAAANCKAVLTGGDGDNVADFSGRSAALQLRNNGTADDGEGSMGAEGVNIGTDIKKMIGGFGADNITGGAGDDIIVGGPGADVITGGTGFDTIDYSGSPAAVTVTMCFTSAITGCGTADDGMTGEMDQIYQMEHVIGSKYNDTLSVYMTTTTELMFEGGEGNDTITGSSANDTIYGDLGDDTLTGGAGDDTISGDAGDDFIDGGDGDGDICLGDSADVTRARVNCEP